MTSDDSVDISDMVRRLHRQNTFTVTTDLTEDQKRIAWTATMAGEDFLDGPWTHERSGESASVVDAVLDAVDAFIAKPGWWARTWAKVTGRG